MAVLSRAVTVATTATRLDSTADATGDGVVGASVQVRNDSGATVFLGGSGVTTATGTPLPTATTSPLFSINEGDAMFGIVAASTSEVRVLEVGSA